jgi:hypothetical protein
LLIDSAARAEIEKFVDDRIDKKLKFEARMKTPGKGNCVFVLCSNGKQVGTAFAVHYEYVLTARHNLVTPNSPLVFGRDAQLRSTSIDFASASITVEMVDIEIVAGGNDSGQDQEDWLLLKRKDGKTFGEHIVPRITRPLEVEARVPWITLYHFPLDYHTEEGTVPVLNCSQCRVVSGENGLLQCQDKLTVTGGSCGGPYVEDATGSALGFHIYGSSAAKAIPKALSSALHDIPLGLQFLDGSSVVLGLRRFNIVV